MEMFSNEKLINIIEYFKFISTSDRNFSVSILENVLSDKNQYFQYFFTVIKFILLKF